VEAVTGLGMDWFNDSIDFLTGLVLPLRSSLPFKDVTFGVYGNFLFGGANSS